VKKNDPAAETGVIAQADCAKSSASAAVARDTKVLCARCLTSKSSLYPFAPNLARNGLGRNWGKPYICAGWRSALEESRVSPDCLWTARTLELSEANRGERRCPRFWVGSIECQVTTDRAASYNPAPAFPGVPLRELSQALTEQLDEKGAVLLPSNPP
jgi:hypothetical protein